MRAGLFRAAALAVALSRMPEQPGRPYGNAAKDLSEAELRRIGARLERGAFSTGRGMGPAELNELAAKRRRARQGKPGKRGQHKR